MREPTSRTSDRAAGFTLIELTLALLIAGLIAALALPRVLPGAGNATQMRIETYRVASLLREDRNTALRTGAPVTTTWDAAARAFVSPGGRRVSLPGGMEAAVDAPIAGAIRFGPDGRSSGGRVVIAATRERTAGGRGAAYTIQIEPLTGGVVVATGAVR